MLRAAPRQGAALKLPSTVNHEKGNSEKFGVLLKTLFFFCYDVWDRQAASVPRVFTPRGKLVLFTY